MKNIKDVKPKYNIVTPSEIFEAGGLDEWAKKTKYNFSIKKFIGKVRLTPQMDKLTTKILMKD